MSAELARLIDGFRVTQTIYAAVELGIPDLLADAERGVDDLAAASGADASALYRLLRALASLGVLHETDGRRFSLTELGRPLRSDVPGSLHGWVRLTGRDYLWRSWGNLAAAVREGTNSFRMLHGADVWEWRADHPEESVIFDEAMTSLTAAGNAAILAAYDFGRFEKVVDVAGGNGALLGGILAAHPQLRGVLFDQQHVVAGAEPVLQAAGVADRCEIVAGSFFESVPEGGDAYVLKSIIHDWEDEESVAILGACREAMGPRAVLLLVERDLGPPNANPAAKLSDLNMLVMPGGRERTVEEYAALLDRAGLALDAVHPTATGHLVIEARLQ
ncbi:MAG TPA: methyltransferase [Gaiellaceae bacterium]|nr:methyltransferase [Gaiellaceae bacterium]